MFPYLDIPSLKLFGPFEIHAFGVLVALGILLGTNRVRHRARQLGIFDEDSASFCTTLIVTGFIVAHVFDVLAYQTANLRELPPLQALLLLVNPASGLSSYGGFLGAVMAGIYVSRRDGIRVLAVGDASLYGLATGWFFGRLGCYTAHDHPGRFTHFFLGVQYPEGLRHDLGLYEALYSLALLSLFALLSRKKRPTGFYVALACVTYGPIRFFLDFLRVEDVPGADPRYLGYTPAQYLSLAVSVLGVVLLVKILRHKGEELPTYYRPRETPPDELPATESPAAATENPAAATGDSVAATGDSVAATENPAAAPAVEPLPAAPAGSGTPTGSA